MNALRLLAVTCVLGVTASAVAAAPPPKKKPRRAKGKVVRVERNQPRVASNANVCMLYEVDVGYCRQPVAVGDVGIVLDEQGNYGRASITSVSPVVDACGVPVTWNIEIDTSQLTRRDYAYNAVLLFGHRLADDARLLPPRGAAPADRPNEQIMAVLDDDGDNQGDLMATTYACDEPGVGTQSRRPSLTCFDTWVEVRDEWRHARTDSVPVCY
ncbi:MAG TPA: hypothetical protein VM261_23495 [Kofleriaceae bacterium]|nr:hypothetical protein [Kofleriaceae bacterium]